VTRHGGGGGTVSAMVGVVLWQQCHRAGSYKSRPWTAQRDWVGRGGGRGDGGGGNVVTGGGRVGGRHHKRGGQRT